MSVDKKKSGNTAEVMIAVGNFAADPSHQNGADLIAAVCETRGLDKNSRIRVLDAYMGQPRKRIRFSEARRLCGLTDARSWHTRCERDPRFREVTIYRETEKSHYCWEDEVMRLLAMLNQGEPINENP